MSKIISKLLLFIVLAIGAYPCFSQVTITMEERGNVFYIPGKVNGLSLEFIFDTGASNVCLSLAEALFMLKNGKLDMQDVKGTSYSSIADGSIVENTNVILREVEVGGIKLTNVEAVVVQNLDAPLLFGQSAIQKLGPIQLDGNTLVISNGKILPSESKAWNLYQKAYQMSEAGNYDEAIKLANQALDATNDNKLRSTIYITLAHSHSNLGEFDKAISALNSSLGEDLTNDIALYNLGVCLFENGKIGEALKNFNRLVERTSDKEKKTMLSNAYYYIGDCNSKLRNVSVAEQAYQKSISFEPTQFAAYSLANLYFDNNRFNDAIPYYRNIVSAEPQKLSSLEVWHKLGYCYVQTNKKFEALDAFHNCMGVASENSDLIFGIAWDDEVAFKYKHLPLDAELWMARLTDDPTVAIRYYDGLYELMGNANNFAPQDYITWFEAVEYAYNPVTKNDKLQEICNWGLTKFPDNPDILFQYTQIKDDKDPVKLDCLYKILKQEFNYRPFSFDYATVYNNIAWYYCLTKQPSKGLPYALNSVKQNPKHGYSWETLGELYFNLGQYQDCVNAMTKVLNCKNSEHMFKSAYEFRGNALMKLGRKKEAKADFDKAKTL